MGRCEYGSVAEGGGRGVVRVGVMVRVTVRVDSVLADLSLHLVVYNYTYRM